METESVPSQPESGTLDVAEWLSQRANKAAEPTTDTGQSEQEASPAEPTVAQPAETPAPRRVAMDDLLPEDFEHGFFKNKPFADLYKSFRATETEMQRSQREAKEAREAVEHLRAKVAAYEVAQQSKPQTQQPDPYNEAAQSWYEAPEVAIQKMRDASRAEAQAIAQQTIQQYQQQAAAQYAQQQQIAEATRVRDAAESARRTLNLDENEWQNEVGVAVAAKVYNPQGPYAARGGAADPANWIDAYNRTYRPTPVVAVPAVSNPPGATRAAPTSLPNAGLPTASEEKRQAWARIAELGGVDPEKFIKRRLQRQGR